MGILQNSLRAADGARHFNVTQTTIMWLIHRLQEIGTTWYHPRSGRPPGTTLSHDWHIRLIWNRCRPSTRTVAPGRHNARKYSHITCVIISSDLHHVTDARVEAPSWQQHAARLHWMTNSLGWWASNWEHFFFFTNESRFCLSHGHGRVRVWHCRG